MVVCVDRGHRNCDGGDGLWLTVADGKGISFFFFFFFFFSF